MEFMINNGALIVALVCMVVTVAAAVTGFFNQPTKQQLAKVKEWLLYAVKMA